MARADLVWRALGLHSRREVYRAGDGIQLRALDRGHDRILVVDAGGALEHVDGPLEDEEVEQGLRPFLILRRLVVGCEVRAALVQE